MFLGPGDLVRGGEKLAANGAEKLAANTVANGTERVRHFTNAKGLEGIEKDSLIKASDQNSVFTVKAKGKPGSPRDIEKALGIKPGGGRNYVEFDASPGEFETVRNPLTGATERVFKGSVDLSGPNPSGFIPLWCK